MKDYRSCCWYLVIPWQDVETVMYDQVCGESVVSSQLYSHCCLLAISYSWPRNISWRRLIISRNIKYILSHLAVNSWSTTTDTPTTSWKHTASLPLIPEGYQHTANVRSISLPCASYTESINWTAPGVYIRFPSWKSISMQCIYIHVHMSNVQYSSNSTHLLLTSIYIYSP